MSPWVKALLNHQKFVSFQKVKKRFPGADAVAMRTSQLGGILSKVGLGDPEPDRIATDVPELREPMKRLSGIGLRPVLTLELHALRRRLALGSSAGRARRLGGSVREQGQDPPNRNSCRIRFRISAWSRPRIGLAWIGDEGRPSAAQNRSNAASRTASASFPARRAPPDRRAGPRPRSPITPVTGPKLTRLDAGGFRGRRAISPSAGKRTPCACRPAFC